MWACLLPSTIDGYASACQGACDCRGLSFTPVCSDGQVYYSPCHAGCQTVLNPGPTESYTDCSCLSNITTVAERGRCTSGCWQLYLAAPVLFVALLCVLVTTTPSTMATLRIVPAELKPFALGINWTILRLLGTIPSPPLVGKVVDDACLIWDRAPDGTSFCALYSKSQMATNIALWWCGANFVAAVFFLLASICISRKRVAKD